MGCCTEPLERILARLDEIAPGVPLLALGQTVLWDEPMKAGVALAAQKLGTGRKLIAGVHDTDYFAKLPSGSARGRGKFKAFPHNDTSTKGLWSAAAEFSALFGSETMATKQDLVNAGLRLNRIQSTRPQALDVATEAWGWRGVVSLEDDPPIAAEVPLSEVWPELQSTFHWAIDTTLDCLSESDGKVAERQADKLKTLYCDHVESVPNGSLSDFYESMLGDLYDFAAGEHVDIESTTTRKLLQFNLKTCDAPRFELLGKFLDPETRQQTVEAYNDALAGTEIYTLDRFGTGAIPFDLVIPGKGRGTIRVGNKGIVIMTPKPQFISLRQPVTSVCELAQVVEKKFGTDCTLIGKAITLIGLLAREFVFVFHEGASSYVKYTRKFHVALNDRGIGLDLNPILRVKFSIWDALSNGKMWFRLPPPLQKPFGTEELCAPSFAGRWKEVGAEQDKLLETLGTLRRPVDLINYLDRHMYGSWNILAKEYADLNEKLEQFAERIREHKAERGKLYEAQKKVRDERQTAEQAKGDHFRAHIFEKEPTAKALKERAAHEKHIREIGVRQAELRRKIADSIRAQKEMSAQPEVIGLHERRRGIELEAEIKRMRMVTNAIMASRGLRNAAQRPSAWWFPLASPDGKWFRDTVNTAQCYLEPLSTYACKEATLQTQ
ncbi:MAG: hypothetical protein KF784_04535 [Fimbriimonadaceae bacterium]|nr:hypothetical protein [Fimbriimonadaceae bacterium]